MAIRIEIGQVFVNSLRPTDTICIMDLHLIFIACNAMTELWSAGCVVSPPRTKSACKISWRRCSLMIWQRYCHLERNDGWLKKVQKLNPTGDRGCGRPKKTRARFLSLARSKLRLCSANHRPGYWSNLPCNWPSTAWAYSEQETENWPWTEVIAMDCPALGLTETHPSNRKTSSGRLRSAVRLDPPLN